MHLLYMNLVPLLLQHMLEKDPGKRATIAEVASSPWFSADSALEERIKTIQRLLPCNEVDSLRLSRRRLFRARR